MFPTAISFTEAEGKITASLGESPGYRRLNKWAYNRGPGGRAMSELEKRVEERFGVLPNFFLLAPEAPEITEKLWGFAQAAYLDNPLPSVFKERLFVHLSRFCAVRYCIARHVGFLVGLGRPAGDPNVCTQSVADVVKLLRRPFPRGQELQSRLSLCAACPAPVVEMPMADTQMEDAIFVLAAHVFLKTSDYLLCLDALARLLGPARLQYLLLFLAFVRAAHDWTETHPEIALEADIDKLLATHEALADCILNDPEARNITSQSLLDELPALRLKADKAMGLLAAIVDSSDDAIVSKTLDGIITSWNAGAERLFGYTASEAVGQHISLIIPANRRNEETFLIERIKKGERIEHFETVRMRKDQTPLYISLTISPVRDASGKIVGASKIARDITQRKRIERELLGMSRKLIEAHEQERTRIARELHDDVVQRLALLSLELEGVQEDVPDAASELRTRIGALVNQTAQIVDDVQLLSHELHSSKLEYLGIVEAAKNFCKEFSERQKVEIDFQSHDLPTGLPTELSLTLFRVLQEALRNAAKHSGVKRFEVRLWGSTGEIHLSISDLGAGFDTETAMKNPGLGLTSMQERLRLVHGELSINSQPRGGATIHARIPFDSSSDSARAAG